MRWDRLGAAACALLASLSSRSLVRVAVTMDSVITLVGGRQRPIMALDAHYEHILELEKQRTCVRTISYPGVYRRFFFKKE